jgi:hypothetical protein
MATGGKSRRAFLTESASGIGAAWLAANWQAIAEAQEFVRTAAASGQPIAFAFFTPEQAAEVEALTAEIIPSDDTPGAREAHVVAFIDRAAAKKLSLSASRFSALSADDKIKLLTSLEKTPFFELARVHTITGFFADPVHGGNHGRVGWALVGWDDSLEHTPPFGYYDALPPTRG